jgi:hypothetical protein
VVDRERLDILEHGTCLQILDKKWETYAKKNFRYSVYLLYWYKSASMTLLEAAPTSGGSMCSVCHYFWVTCGFCVLLILLTYADVC